MRALHLFILLCLSFQFTVSEDRIPMILDLVQYYKGNVAAKLCWPMADKVGLATKIMNAENSRSIQFTNNFHSIGKYIGEDMIIIFDLNCVNHLDLDSQRLMKETDTKIFEKPFTWLIIPNANSTLEIILEELQNLSFFINSEVMVANKMDNYEILHLIYKIHPTSEMITEFYGTWSPKNGLNVSEDMKMTTALRRKNLGGTTIFMSVVVTHEETKTDIYNMDTSNTKTDVYAKYTFINIIPLYEFMNATQKLIFTDTWGYPSNGTFNGMVGHLIRGEADLGGTMILMTSERREMITYLTPTFEMRAAFVFLAPPLSLQNNLFVLPFKNSVWACIGALIFVLAVVIYVHANWERTKGAMIEDDPTSLHPRFSDISVYIAGMMTQQGSFTELKGTLGRLVTFITLLSFLFLYTYYSGSIVALLQSTSDQIRTLTDLLNSKLELGVEDQPYNRHFFTKSSDRVRKLIYENKVARVGYKPNFMEISEGVRKIQTSPTPFAFHMDLGHGYKIVNRFFQEHEKCGLREIEYLPKGRPWFSARKKSIYGEIYKLGLIRITEHGLSDRLNNQVQARKPGCILSGGTVAPVNMVDFKPVLLCWLYGAIFSVVLLAVEIIVYRRTGRMTL